MSYRTINTVIVNYNTNEHVKLISPFFFPAAIRIRTKGLRDRLLGSNPTVAVFSVAGPFTMATSGCLEGRSHELTHRQEFHEAAGIC
jgi:hypothetical protein